MAQNQAPLVAADLLNAAGLGQVWQAKLAVRECECIEKLYILGDKICAITSTNYMFCLDRNNGNLAFGIQLASEGFPVLAPRLYENQLLITAGNKLIQVDASGGAVTYMQKFDYTVVCPVVRNKENLYAAGIDRRIHSIVLADKRYLFNTGAENDSMPTSLLAGNGSVIFATDKGNILCIQADRPQLRWQYNASDKIAAPIVRDNNDLYAASMDTYLYRLNASTGKPVWKYQLGGMPKDSPRVTGTVVYQYVPNGGVTAVDKASGKPLWMADNGIDLLAEINGKAYVMTSGRTATVVDNLTGKRLFTINLAQASLDAANMIDGKIYIADTKGRVACIAAAK
jgi:outer membrane protein assembly factor BamB